MPVRDLAIVFDCGATNIRAVAIDRKGEIKASESYPNQTWPDPCFPGGKIWDVNDIWNKICSASVKVLDKIDRSRVAGVTITTFGVDGTLFDGNGAMLYPVISWQCERTGKIMSEINKYIDLPVLYKESGVLPFNFNTINKLIWFKENRTDMLEKSRFFLFIPSIFAYFLTGEMVNDITMAGTSMVTSLKNRTWSEKILKSIGFPLSCLGDPVEPGTITGKVTDKGSAATGLPIGLPVVATGHDTQFAIFGSGAGVSQPVLSSGTWEILMVRSSGFRSGKEQLESGITTELDVKSGLFNIGNQWIASGILEWAKRTLYPDIKENIYEVMIKGASSVPHVTRGVKVNPRFYEESNGYSAGAISGITMDTTRDEIFRAMLEALSLRLKEGIDALEKAGGFKTDSLLCVGGGSKNDLWNQLRANIAGVPVIVTDKTETTVLGASLFVQYATGNASSPDEAQKNIDYKTKIFEPEK